MHEYIEATRFAAQSLINLIRDLIREAEDNVKIRDNHKKSIEFLSQQFMDSTQFSERATHDCIQLQKMNDETSQIEKDHKRYLVLRSSSKVCMICGHGGQSWREEV